MNNNNELNNLNTSINRNNYTNVTNHRIEESLQINNKKNIFPKIVLVLIIIICMTGLLYVFFRMITLFKENNVETDKAKYEIKNYIHIYSSKDFNSDDYEEAKAFYNIDEINIPPKYNTIDVLKQTYNIDVEIEDQKNLGLCSLFSMNKNIELKYMLETGKTLDLSERYISYLLSNNYYVKDKNAGEIDFSDGLHNSQGIGTSGFIDEHLAVASTVGIASENDIPYINYKENELYKIDNAKPILKINEIIEFDQFTWRNSSDINNEYRNIFKAHIIKNGSLAFSYESPRLDYYNPINFSYNYMYKNDVIISPEEIEGAFGHALTIVGWDDNYPKENFISQPQNDGAWIVLNSWGSNFGNNGYFYVSYEADNYQIRLYGVTEISASENKTIYTYDKYMFTENMEQILEEPFEFNKDEEIYLGYKFDVKENAKYINEVIFELVNTKKYHEIELYINTQDNTFDKQKMLKLNFSNFETFILSVLKEKLKVENDKFSIVIRINNSDFETIQYTKSYDSNDNLIKGNMYTSKNWDEEWTISDYQIPLFIFGTAN